MEVVFLVEGDASVQQALVRLMQAEGLAVRPFACVDDFLRVVPGTAPACAVIDVTVARGWTLEARRSLAALAATIPIVAIDASDEPGVRRVARRIGAQAYFRKPIDASALVDAVRWALRMEGTGPGGAPGPVLGDEPGPAGRLHS
jgi:FixJ family two-component response regulator